MRRPLAEVARVLMGECEELRLLRKQAALSGLKIKINGKRQDLIRKGIEAFTEANNSLGSGTDFTMGAANLLF